MDKGIDHSIAAIYGSANENDIKSKYKSSKNHEDSYGSLGKDNNCSKPCRKKVLEKEDNEKQRPNKQHSQNQSVVEMIRQLSPIIIKSQEVTKVKND